MMNYRRLGRTGLDVSVVGFGTCQLRMVPSRQAVATLRRGFELGVNLVHTAPDYEGADDLVAAAIAATGQRVYVCANGYGDMAHFEHLFETTLDKFGGKRLELFGIASVEDREELGENVWGGGGMVEFLRRQQARGRLGSTFCTTHGSPVYSRGLIQSDAFDAVMLAYNPLGYHLLSFRPPAPRAPEAVRENRELFALAVKHGVGLMLMETLAGGLLCPPEAFAPHEPDALGRVDRPTARQVLRLLLRSCSEVACVVPGTASVVEAEENARAGHGLLHDVDEATDGRAIAAAVDSLTAT